MVILLFGTDTYRLKQKLNEIISHYQKTQKGGLNLKYFEGKELNYESFRDEISQSSMFAEKKLLVLRDVFSNNEFKKKFLGDPDKIVNSKDIVLFCQEEEIPKNDCLFKLLKKSAKIQEFPLLKGQKLKNWLRKEVEFCRGKIDSLAIDKLIDFAGNDSWRLSNEIQKLVNFCKNETIQSKNIEILVKPKIDADIFKTIDAIALGRKKEALLLLHKHLEKGDSPLYLLNMINFQFRNLLMVKSCQFNGNLGRLGLHPYVLRKTAEQAERFTFPELKKIYQKIFQADFNIKTGKIEPETALDLLLAGV